MEFVTKYVQTLAAFLVLCFGEARGGVLLRMGVCRRSVGPYGLGGGVELEGCSNSS